MITDFASLQTEIWNELNRKDLEPKTPLWVQLAESRLRRDLNVGRGHENNAAYRNPYASLDGVETTTNYVLDNHPDVYFYGSLLHSAPYLDDDQRIATWERYYYAAVERINLRAQQFPATTDEHYLQLSSNNPCPIVRDEDKVQRSIEPAPDDNNAPVDGVLIDPAEALTIGGVTYTNPNPIGGFSLEVARPISASNALAAGLVAEPDAPDAITVPPQDGHVLNGITYINPNPIGGLSIELDLPVTAASLLAAGLVAQAPSTIVIAPQEGCIIDGVTYINPNEVGGQSIEVETPITAASLLAAGLVAADDGGCTTFLLV